MHASKIVERNAFGDASAREATVRRGTAVGDDTVAVVVDRRVARLRRPGKHHRVSIVAVARGARPRAPAFRKAVLVLVGTGRAGIADGRGFGNAWERRDDGDREEAHRFRGVAAEHARGIVDRVAIAGKAT